ncbi:MULTISPECIES: hypothetical protein [unclassified Pseudoalteromonas]|uniref:hypothetical protein n=1 Tax=unclassified Pseudoalteromonas TaxID=194690 RepID=UPI0030155A5E
MKTITKTISQALCFAVALATTGCIGVALTYPTDKTSTRYKSLTMADMEVHFGEPDTVYGFGDSVTWVYNNRGEEDVGLILGLGVAVPLMFSVDKKTKIHFADGIVTKLSYVNDDKKMAGLICVPTGLMTMHGPSGWNWQCSSGG